MTHRSSGTVAIRELEAFLVLAEELHFGRTGERLYVSQSRISQLLRSLESRVGARLVERTSRRVRLTPLGERFVADLRPAYETLHTTLETVRAAARGVEGTLRIGFQGTFNDHIVRAVALLQDRHPGVTTEIVEVPLADPFGAVRGDEVDAAVVLLPVEEPDLVLGPVFSRQPQTLAVSAAHPLAARASVPAEELAGCALIGIRGPAPEYWRRAGAPERTPGGTRIPAGPLVATLQEGLTLAAADRGAMLLCRPTAEYHGRRALAFVPVEGLPESALGLVWHRSRETARIRAFAEAITRTAQGLRTGSGPTRVARQGR
ncbi:LysR family transcriptional regulator [Streptomyces sp. SP18CS02]|uniref:LysR family transcriptional regulator n=1 Tax=Streptomyces sp. SP18CS02 TaxID=3002531 RepID=UPI002E76DB73|nr:LysR family transcriptional regulator [Streptomyces sp. SP18CS02]MEE1755669.1 LysR family transcriptional regulator [Streptomyces sp. SP18CS02]